MADQPFVEQSDDETYDVTSLLELHTRTVLGKIHTGFVGEVVKFNAEKRTANVRPCATGRFINGDANPFPVLPGVPIMYPGSGDFLVSFPLVVGSFVWVSVAERSMDEWKAEASKSYTPASRRRFSLSDAVCYPSIQAPGQTSEVDGSKMVIGDVGANGLTIEITQDGKVTIGTSVELLDLIDQGLAEVATLAASVVATMGGPQPLSNGAAVATAIGNIRTLLAQIKG